MSEKGLIPNIFTGVSEISDAFVKQKFGDVGDLVQGLLKIFGVSFCESRFRVCVCFGRFWSAFTSRKHVHHEQIYLLLLFYFCEREESTNTIQHGDQYCSYQYCLGVRKRYFHFNR